MGKKKTKSENKKWGSWFHCVACCAEKVVDPCIERCVRNYNYALCPHWRTIPSHLLFPFSLISEERLAAGGMTLRKHSSFPQNWAEACRGKSIELCGLPPTRPPARLPLTRPCCRDNGHAEVEVITVRLSLTSLACRPHFPASDTSGKSEGKENTPLISEKMKVATWQRAHRSNERAASFADAPAPTKRS